VELAVFSGRGAHFCAGFDLRDLDQTSDADLRKVCKRSGEV
jgi:enoyl-CoA hydratase/carnithine racemase